MKSLIFGLFCVFAVVLPPMVARADAKSPLDLAPFSLSAAAMKDAVAALPPVKDYPVRVIRREFSIVYRADMSARYFTHEIFQIVSLASAQGWDVLSSGWAPWNQDKPLITARVIDGEGKIHVPDPKTFEESTPKNQDGLIFTDRKLLRVPLPGLGDGSIVEFTMEVNNFKPFFPAGDVQEFYVGDWVPVDNSRFTLECPDTVPLRYGTQLLGNVVPKVVKADGRIRIEYSFGPLLPLTRPDPYSLPDAPLYPMVRCSTGESWRAIASSYSDVLEAALVSTDLRTSARAVVGSRALTRDKIDALIQWMAKEIRYTGIEFGDSAIVPHSPAETLARKYGDCKDKATLLVAMLRSLGIQADLALLWAGQGSDIDPAYPGMGDFNHAIVHVNADIQLWIDPTDNFARYGQIPLEDQGRLALIASRSTTALVTIPRSPSSENVVHYDRTYVCADYGAGKIVDTAYSSGYMESWARSYFVGKTDKEKSDWARQYTDDLFLSKDVRTVSTTSSTDLANQFSRSVEIATSNRAYTYIDSTEVWIPYDQFFERLPALLTDKEPGPDEGTPLDERSQDLLLPQNYRIELRATIQPPPGLVAVELPDAQLRTLGPATLNETFSVNTDGSVLAVFRFDTGKERYTVSEARAARDAIVELKGGDGRAIYFEPRALILEKEGKAREALAAYHEASVSHPESAVWHVRLSRALREQGQILLAQEEARKATELAPKSAIFWSEYGDSLSWGNTGEEYGSGTSFPAIQKAYKTAYELNPKNTYIAGNYAIYCEYNARGERYGFGARLDEAIRLYREVGSSALKDLDLGHNLAYALFYNGAYKAANDECLANKDPAIEVLVASDAMVNGASHAWSLASRKVSNAATRKETLSTVVKMLFFVREYSVCGELVKLFAPDDSVKVYQNALAFFSKKLPLQTYFERPTTPSIAVQNFLYHLFLRDFTQSELEATLTKGAIDPDELKEVLDALLVSQGLILTSLKDLNISVANLIDLCQNLAVFTTDNVADMFYRVEVKIMGTSALSCVVVPEDGVFKIAAVGGDVSALSPMLKTLWSSQNFSALDKVLNWGMAPTPVSRDPFDYNRLAKVRDLWQGKSYYSDALAVLASQAPVAPDFAPLQAAYANPADPSLRQLLAISLAEAYMKAGKSSEALPILENLKDTARGSAILDSLLIRAYRDTGHLDKADSLANLMTISGGKQLEEKARNRIVEQDYASAYSLLSQLSAPTPLQERIRAMTLIAAGLDSTEVLAEYARAQAILETNKGSVEVLAALALLSSALGYKDEALAYLGQQEKAGVLTMGAQELGVCSGLMAEALGLRDGARLLYGKVRGKTRAEKLVSPAWSDLAALLDARLAAR